MKESQLLVSIWTHQKSKTPTKETHFLKLRRPFLSLPFWLKLLRRLQRKGISVGYVLKKSRLKNIWNHFSAQFAEIDSRWNINWKSMWLICTKSVDTQCLNCVRTSVATAEKFSSRQIASIFTENGVENLFQNQTWTKPKNLIFDELPNVIWCWS